MHGLLLFFFLRLKSNLQIVPSHLKTSVNTKHLQTPCLENNVVMITAEQENESCFVFI